MMTTANLGSHVKRMFHVHLHDARTGFTSTRILSARSSHGAFERATAERADWTEAEVCLPNGDQIAIYDREDA